MPYILRIAHILDGDCTLINGSLTDCKHINKFDACKTSRLVTVQYIHIIDTGLLSIIRIDLFKYMGAPRISFINNFGP